MWTITWITEGGKHNFLEYDTLEELSEGITVAKHNARSKEHINIFPPDSNIDLELIETIILTDRLKKEAI